jgi:hypothetical protein
MAVNLRKIGRNAGKSLIGLIVLLSVVEIVLRLAGNKPGVFNGDFDPNDTLNYNLDLKTDSSGILRYVSEYPMLPDSARVNRQGFRSKFAYDCLQMDSLRRTNPLEQIVMMVGDSYVAGCCIDRLSDCFTDRLDREPAMHLMNFGVGSVTPQQYCLVTQKYLPLLLPDQLIVCIFLGNDIMRSDPVPKPNLYPWFLNQRQSGWVAACPPDYLAGTQDICFSDPEAARVFYLENATLKGPNRNLLERFCGHTVIFSKLVLGLEYYARKREMNGNSDDLITYRYLKQIALLAASYSVPVQFIGIPSPIDVADQVDLDQAYGKYFGDLTWVHPPINLLTPSDYDGMKTSSHFTLSGHEKFYQWISRTIKTGNGSMRD